MIGVMFGVALPDIQMVSFLYEPYAFIHVEMYFSTRIKPSGSYRKENIWISGKV